VLQAGIDAVLQPLGAGLTPSGTPKVASAAEAEAALNSGASFLEDLARESYEPAVFTQPAVVTYSVPLAESETLIWAYAWCAADTATLDQNFENIQLKFKVDEETILENSLSTYEIESGGQQCRLIYSALSDWPAGEHHLSTTATFTAAINDGKVEYPPGDYVLEYSVYVKP
jgi:hypothetical protein